MKALKNLKRYADEYGGWEIEVVDVFEHPEMAEDDHVIATPTLLRKLPLPIRSVVGDLSEKERVLMGLELQVEGAEEP